VELRSLPTCPTCGWIGFCDPKVVAVALIEAGAGRVWLVRRAIEPRVGEWALPGGYVDAAEHPAVAAVRECREEMLCEVEVGTLVGVEHASFGDAGVVVIAYAGRVVGGSPAPGPEVLEVGHWEVGATPPLAFATHAAFLRVYGDAAR